VTEYHLDSVRSRLDEAIQVCTRQETQADLVTSDEPCGSPPAT